MEQSNRSKYHDLNPEVLYSKDALTLVDGLDIEFLKQESLLNPRKRIRLCTHTNQDNLLHEMLIVHDRNAYIRPHMHPGKSESTHVIDGLVDIVLFNEHGRIKKVIQMGGYSSGKIFYYRMEEPIFHTLIIRSDLVVFHESTNGPFDRNETIFPRWAPMEDDLDAIVSFMADLNSRLEKFKN